MNDRARPAVLVTGASSGIGHVTARELGLRGYAVFGTVRRLADADLLRPWATAVRLDVGDPASIAAATVRIVEHLDGQPLHALVNSAGISRVAPLALQDPAELRRLFEVNVTGLLAVIQAMLPLLRAGGRIVNIGSLSGRLVLPLLGGYSATKSAVDAISDALRRELASMGIHVTVIAPGRVRTPMHDKVAAQDWDRYRRRGHDELVDRYLRHLAASRDTGIPPEKVAQAVAKVLAVRRPPTRVLMVPGSRWRAGLLLRLPDRWLDFWIARRLWR
jgi:NAD(P)-dependent dehydrogenase (short-subunit alcohol dehydrogenase family)